MHLHPPGILVVPHADALGVPGLVFALGIPAGDIHVMHAAVVEWRAFRLVALGGHVAGGHVADAHYRQVADLAFGDESLDFLVVPGIAIEQVDRNKAVAGLDPPAQIPLGLAVGGDGLFRKNVFVG